jgi:hypothetical protein
VPCAARNRHKTCWTHAVGNRVALMHQLFLIARYATLSRCLQGVCSKFPLQHEHFPRSASQRYASNVHERVPPRAISPDLIRARQRGCGAFQRSATARDLRFSHGSFVLTVRLHRVGRGGLASRPNRQPPALAAPEPSFEDRAARHSRGLAVSFADRDLVLRDRGSSANGAARRASWGRALAPSAWRASLPAPSDR